MEGLDGFNTLECLRGRLLAERQASRVAKEEVQSMGIKFVELERKLREEIKLRDKAERKLKFLQKRLKTFSISSPSSWQSSLSQKCENSCRSSSGNTASRVSEANETKLHTVNPALLENEVHSHNVAEKHVHIQTYNSPFITKDCGPQLNYTSSYNSDSSDYFPQIPGNTPNQGSDNLKNDENRLRSFSSKSSQHSGISCYDISSNITGHLQ
ncbi:hypothetical protein RJT34_18993 [Clitoria ternatea]|uniref:Uncharacterized protein n=1 Tax=Clitoria ternatea TaxID=43366 RepID=A0AAN9IQI0_CLITE